MAAQDKEPEAKAKKAPPRWQDAAFVGGVWLASDGTPLTDAEAQQAHRAMDRAAAQARARAIRGET